MMRDAEEDLTETSAPKISIMRGFYFFCVSGRSEKK